MTQLGEAIAVAIFEDPKLECPFCESKEDDPQKLTHEVINDSRILGGNTAGRVEKKVQHPDAEKTIYIWDDYWDTEDRSKISWNAHHAIPGNASLAKAKALQKWIAWKFVVKKNWYSNTITLPAGKVRTKRRREAGLAIERKEFSKLTRTGKPKLLIRETTSGNKVTGKVKYDINCMENGIWLPSNEAVANWGEMPGKFKKTYAWRAMRKCGAQFHDAHEDYSNAVRDELLEFDKKLDKISQGCRKHKKSQKDPFPAPQRLLACLNKLSNEIKNRKLKARKGHKFKHPWITSSLADGYKHK